MTDLEKLVNNMSTEEFMRLFDFATGDQYKPEQKIEKLTDQEILKELGL